MPVDNKRINGPEESVPYQLFTRLNTKTLQNRFKECIKDGDKRLDERQPREHRKIYVKTGVVSQAKGSSYIELGETKVVVSVFDPREIPNRPDYSLKGEINCDFKFATFSCVKRRLHQQDDEEKQYSSLMKKALESAVCLHELPNFQVDIYALVLQNDGSALSAAINGAGLALAQAGVPMYDIITSATLAIQQNVKFLDPSATEEDICKLQIPSDDSSTQSDHGIVIVSKLHTQEQVSQFYQSGNLGLLGLEESLKILLKSCEDIVQLMQKSLVKYVVNSCGDEKS